MFSAFIVEHLLNECPIFTFDYQILEYIEQLVEIIDLSVKRIVHAQKKNQLTRKEINK
jgi:hypothetical protein